MGQNGPSPSRASSVEDNHVFVFYFNISIFGSNTVRISYRSAKLQGRKNLPLDVQFVKIETKIDEQRYTHTSNDTHTNTRERTHTQL